jgi:predicted negative regulator of RcsB-dependent stress response
VARISRKDLKKDELRETFSHGAESVVEHRRGLGEIAGIVLVIVLAVLGWRYYSAHQTAKASAALDDAMTIFNARILTPGAPAQPGEVTYTDEDNKYADAAKKFDAVADSYGRTRPGQEARYFAGICQLHLTHIDQAEKELTTAANSGDPAVQALANFQLANVYTKMGRNDEGIKIYQGMIAKPTVIVPKPMVMLALADVYKRTNPSEAIKVLNQIKTEFPDSPAAEEANKLLEMPAGKS